MIFPAICMTCSVRAFQFFKRVAAPYFGLARPNLCISFDYQWYLGEVARARAAIGFAVKIVFRIARNT
jgi:hypothetical protein